MVPGIQQGGLIFCFVPGGVERPPILKNQSAGGALYANVVFSNRGPGLDPPATGNIDPEYHAALKHPGLEAWAGDNAKWRPADISDLLLHGAKR